MTGFRVRSPYERTPLPPAALSVPSRRLSARSAGQELFEPGELGQLLPTRLDLLGDALVALLDDLQIGERQLRVDDLLVAQGPRRRRRGRRPRRESSARCGRSRRPGGCGSGTVVEALLALAPSTRPAMSTNSIAVGVTRSGAKAAARTSSRSSGRATTPTLGRSCRRGSWPPGARRRQGVEERRLPHVGKSHDADPHGRRVPTRVAGWPASRGR